MSPETPPSCVAADAFLVELAYGETSAVPAEARGHIAACPRCAAALGALRRTRAVMGALPLEEPSPAVDARILAALDAQMGVVRPAPPRRWLPRLFAVGSLTLVAALALVRGEAPDAATQRPAAAPAAAPASSPVAPEDQAEAAARAEPAREASAAPPESARAASPRPPPADLARVGSAGPGAPSPLAARAKERRIAADERPDPALAKAASPPPAPPSAPVALRAAPRASAFATLDAAAGGRAASPLADGDAFAAPGAPAPPASLVADGRRLLEARRFAEALALYEQLLAREGVDPVTRTRALEGRVDALYGLGRHDEAEAAASNLAPSSPARARLRDPARAAPSHERRP